MSVFALLILLQVRVIGKCVIKSFGKLGLAAGVTHDISGIVSSGVLVSFRVYSHIGGVFLL